MKTQETIFKKLVRKVGAILGFITACGLGVMGGIDAAIMFPQVNIFIGLLIGMATCFVCSVNFYYIIRGDENDKKNDAVKEKETQRNTFGSILFASAAVLFIGTSLFSNFLAPYVGITVLGSKVSWTNYPIILQVLGVIFGLAGALSGLIINTKVSLKFWEDLKSAPKTIENRPDNRVCSTYDNTVEKPSPTIVNNFKLKKTKVEKLKETNSIPILVHNQSEMSLAKALPA